MCDLCGRGFRQKSQLRLHKKRHLGDKKYDCTFCSSKFITKGDLQRHIKSHLGQRDYACNICEKTFTRQQTLNEHLNRHYGLKPFECKICGQTFSEMSAVYKHVKTHVKNISDQEIQNDIIIHRVENVKELEDIPEDSAIGTVLNIDEDIENVIRINS